MKCGHCNGAGHTVMCVSRKNSYKVDVTEVECNNPLCRGGQEPDNGEYWMCECDNTRDVVIWANGMEKMGFNPVFRLVRFDDVVFVAVNEFGMDFAT